MKPPAPLQLPPEIESSGWNFDDETRLAYRKIIGDPKARRAFEKLTTGNRPISAAHLLLNLRELERFPNSTWKDWHSWQDKWEYLERAVKGLRRIASKMQKYLEPRYRGPIPLPTWTGPEDEGYSKSHLAEQRLKSITELERSTGRPHTEDVAALLNVVRGRAGGPNEVTVNELHKLSKRFSAAPRIAHWFRPR